MINYQFGDIDANGSVVRPPPPRGKAQCQAILPNMLAASEFWPDRWSTAGRHAVAPGDLEVIEEDPNDKIKEDTCLL